MSRPLRVAVTVEQSWQRVPGGTAASTVALLAKLREDPGLTVVGVAARHGEDAAQPWRPPVPVHQLPLPRPALYRSWHSLRWPRVDLGLRERADVIHATSPAIPPATAPLVATVHDLAFLDEPQWYTTRGVSFLRRGTDLARRKAAAVVVPSRQTLDDCVRAGFDPSLLHVVPHGVDAPTATPADAEALRARLGLTRPFILWCGTHEPRKNLPGLLSAFARLVDGNQDPGVDLVLVGPAGWGTATQPPPAVSGRIHRTGFLSAADLGAAYAGAAAFCYPSLREGFGMPVLEAMSYGLPVVTSRYSPMADLVGATGVTVDPRRPEDIEAGLREALAHRRAYGPPAAARARGYTWQAAADTLALIYRAVADRAAGPPEPSGSRSPSGSTRPSDAT